LDARKLDALRQKYADGKGGDIFDPSSQRSAATVFSGTERRKWPFADPATFLGLPFRPDALSRRTRARRAGLGAEHHGARS
jgi:agmatinase